jgi:hypothetical protein
MASSIDFLFEGALDHDCGEHVRSESIESEVTTFRDEFSGPNAKRLGNFRCETSRLKELVRLLSGSSNSSTLPVCAVSHSFIPGWDDARFDDAMRLTDFQAKGEPFAELRAYSVRLPQFGAVEGYFDDLKGFSSVDVEVVFERSREDMENVIGLASEREYLSLGFLVRSMDDFPFASRCATQCLGLEIPFRFIGLRGNRFTERDSLGLLNALGGVALSFSEDLSENHLLEVFESKAIDDWAISPEGLGFKRFFATKDRIVEARTLLEGVGVESISKAVGSIESLTETERS